MKRDRTGACVPAGYAPTRRGLTLPGMVVPLGLVACEKPATAQADTSSRACGGQTLRSSEGPFFKPGSPERQSLLEPGTPGARMMLTGVVRALDCQTIAGVLIDIWQADTDGHYDTAGFGLPDIQFTGKDGGYRLDTVLPGRYPGRTRHIHVKLQRPGGRVLTTELYVPDAPGNAADGQFAPALLMRPAGGTESVQHLVFDFVLG